MAVIEVEDLARSYRAKTGIRRSSTKEVQAVKGIRFRNRFYSVRFFFGFTVGGLAVPIIGALHRGGDFGEVLLVTAAIAAVIFTCALATWLLSRPNAACLNAS